MTVVESEGRTRAVIDVPDGTDYGVFTLANPNRLVVDLHDCRLGSDFHVAGPDGVIANVRTGAPTPGDVRVVFDLAAKVRSHSTFQNENGHAQLVIELLSVSDAGKTASVKPDSAKFDLAKFDLAKSDPAKSAPVRPDPIVQQTTGTGMVAPDRDSGPGASEPPTVIAANIAATNAPMKLAPSIKHPSAAELRKLNPRVDPPVSTAVILPDTRPAGTQDDAADAVVIPDATTQRARPGARTLRDVLGSGQRKIVIAVDAGHGGQDTGARGYSGTYEKNVTLATARELARQINAEPGMQAVLTRDGDYFVPLAERYHKARAAKADLFISIHADADPTHSATGSSVWVLSQRGVTSQAARWLADRENAADLIGGVSLSDKDNTLASVLLDLSQSATMKASEDAAERVHQALRDIGRTHKSHPESANFVVLRSPDVPSMLVETAFITNAEEEQHLNDAGYRSRLANAVLSGVRGYFIDNPLPGTQYAALHASDRHRNARASAAMRDQDDEQMLATAAPNPATPMASMDAGPMQLASADDAQQIHVVQRGERLIDIANQYGVSVMKLRELNDLDGNRVRTGQQLRIPARSGAG
ncbi:MAG TPA: N-acetylmuramoyl-L-alanine amidase [Xanthomonadaceae bacterium]|nr:N-acetylmuramoyl-L-alanine amidase [Xanthomonadaceae bacterium]